MNGLIRPGLQHVGITPQPILLDGNVSEGRVAREMSKLFWSFDSVTSFVDYYGFKDRQDKSVEHLQSSIDRMTRTTIGRKHNCARVFSYIQKHEFEGLLFSDTEAFDRLYGDDCRYWQALGDIRSQFHTPEDINDGQQTAPSKRVTDIIPGYHKVLHGPVVAAEIGLDAIRSECPCLDAWFSRLESLNEPD